MKPLRISKIFVTVVACQRTRNRCPFLKIGFAGLLATLTLPCCIWAQSAPAPASDAVAAEKDSEQTGPTLLQTSPEPVPTGIRRWDDLLLAKGIEPHASLKTQFTGALFGSDGPLRADAVNLLEVSTAVDLRKVTGWKGARLYVSMHNLAGGNGSDEILEDLQGYSNINAGEGTHLFELWMEQTLRNGKIRFKAGRIDANTEFAFVENGGAFLNSSMGYSPAIGSMPTYPFPRSGAAMFLRPKSWYYVSEGAFQDNPRGSMSLSEGGIRWKLKGLAGRIAYGYWFHTQLYEAKQDETHQGAQGNYAVVEHEFWNLGESPNGAARGIAGFLQYGEGDPWSTEMDRHVGFGAQWRGPWSGRPIDVAGIGASMVHLVPSDDPSLPPRLDHERNYEGFYRAQVNRWLSLTFDGQLINRPHGDPECLLTMAGSLRSTITF